MRHFLAIAAIFLAVPAFAGVANFSQTTPETPPALVGTDAIGDLCTEPPGNCHANSFDNATQSNNNFWSADNFEVDANGSITDVCWWGVYIPFFAPLPTTDFEIQYYTDTAGLPGATICSLYDESGGTLNVTALDTGVILLALTNIWEWTGTHAGCAVSSGTPYWIRITDPARDGTAGQPTWFWDWSQDDDSRAALIVGPPGPWQVDPAHDLAFCLNLPLAGAGPPPPLPTMSEWGIILTALLVLTALAVFIHRRRANEA